MIVVHDVAIAPGDNDAVVLHLLFRIENGTGPACICLVMRILRTEHVSSDMSVAQSSLSSIKHACPALVVWRGDDVQFATISQLSVLGSKLRIGVWTGALQDAAARTASLPSAESEPAKPDVSMFIAGHEGWLLQASPLGPYSRPTRREVSERN
ncbi:hypothetical protein N183_24330 [Sinorhizobium sp. Sb3]|nr:hypothetical protein N183_24330 [Sinorhizobium sp. Sb3]